MKILTPQECVDLCSKAGCPSTDVDTKNVFVDGPFEIPATIPSSVTKQEYWMRICFDLLGTPEQYLVWLSEWNVLSMDANLMCLIEGYRRSHGDIRPIGEAPGHLFAASDSSGAQALIRFAMAFEWGAYLVAIGGRPVTITFNDCFLKIKCRDGDSFRQVRKQLNRLSILEGV